MIFDLYQVTNPGMLALRFAVAVIFIYHAMPKLKNYKGMGSGMGMSSGFILLLGLTELSSALALITGYFMEIGAILLSMVMIGAITFKIKKWRVPFFAQNATGWEFDFILLSANIAILLS
ncbi:MAG TPA: DoxX family membrane protein [Candidatus Paceibacterota bacterium]